MLTLPRKNNTLLWFATGLLLIVVYYLPAIIAGENTYVCIHDFLDSTMAHIKSMKDNGTLFDYSATMPMMCSLPRFIYEPSFNLKIWIYALVNPFWGVLLNSLLVRITAYTGLFLLLSRYVIPKDEWHLPSCFIASILFAALPYYVDYGVSSAGIPLIAFAFINLFKKKDIAASFLILAYYAINNSIMLGGFFACAAMALYILIHIIRKKEFPILPFVGLCFLSIVCVAANWNMIYGFFTYSEPMSRAEYIKPFSWGDLLDGLLVLLIGQYHASCFLAAIIIAVFIPIWKKYRAEDRFLDWTMQAFVALVAIIAITTIAKRTLNFITIVREFQFDRFFFLYPAICFTMVGAVAYEWLRHARKKSLIALSVVLLITNLAFDINFRESIGRKVGLADSPDFKRFYDTELFERIKRELNISTNDDKVVCVGMYQAVAEYNGIYTLDGYIQMYPISYKRQFQKVIQGELDKSAELYDYYCNWGSRCYVHSAELGLHYEFGRHRNASIKQLDIDTEVLREMGCKYILSAVDIENWQELGLQQAGRFTDEKSFWEVRAYRL